MIRVLLADDHQMFIDGVKAFLKNEPDIQVVGEAVNREQLVAVMQQQAVDVVVLDARIPDEREGELACKFVRKNYPNTKVLMLTMFDKPSTIMRFFNNKANGYILKERSKEELIGAIHAVHKKNSYYPREIMNKVIEAPLVTPEEEANFTDREMEVLALVSKGLQDKEIGKQLFIDEKTVRKHCQNMRRKAGVSNRVELSNYARERGLI